MKRLYLLSLALILLLSTVLAEVEIEEGVIVLNNSNFDEEIAKYEHLLVEFYAPWCGHCKQLAPEYARAAQKLRENDPPYYLAKIDATESRELSERFAIQSFPTLFFFKHGEKLAYTGGRTELEIVNWILKRVGPPALAVTCDQLKQKTQNAEFATVYFGDSKSKSFIEVYLEVAQHPSVSEKYQFFHSNDKNCASQYNVDSFPSLVLFRKIEESPITFSGSWETTPIVDFLISSSVPTFVEFSEEYVDPIFSQRKAAIFLFRHKEDNEEDFVQVFAETAKKMKGEILFVISGVKEGIQFRLAEFVDATKRQLPFILLLNPSDNMKKYIFSKDVKTATVEDLKQFIDDFKNKKVSPYLKSEDVPYDNSKPVKVIVGKTHQDMVIRNDNDVFVKYYAPWCGHCKQLAPIWEDLASELQNVPNLVIAELDSSANEIDGLEIRGYPTLKFYSQGKKNQPIDYDGERDLENFKKWLLEKSNAYKKYLEKRTDL